MFDKNITSTTIDKKVSATLGKVILIALFVIGNVFSIGFTYANLKNEINAKADKSTVEKYIVGDSINTRSLFQQLDKLDKKMDHLLRKNKIDTDE